MDTFGSVEKSPVVKIKELFSITPESGSEMEGSLGVTNESRLVDLLQAIHQIGKLRRETANAEVDARQKMREVGFKRQSVWLCDAAFMKEVQRLAVKEPVEKFGELRSQAAECQAARDGLGPLEQEGIDAEQRWEGHNWTLRQAEEDLYEEFREDFGVGDAYPPLHLSVPSSQNGSYSDSGSFHNGELIDEDYNVPFRPSNSVTSLSRGLGEPSNEIKDETSENGTSQFLLGLTHPPNSDDYLTEWASDSGIGELDAPDSLYNTESLARPQSLPVGRDAITQRYPELVSDFGTRRSRINKWLLHTMLLSHLEADLLIAQFDSENPNRPSNWSQLVIAYWDLDAASLPNHETSSASKVISYNSHAHDQPEAARSESASHSSMKADDANAAVQLPRARLHSDGDAKFMSIVSPTLQHRAGIGWESQTM